MKGSIQGSPLSFNSPQISPAFSSCLWTVSEFQTTAREQPKMKQSKTVDKPPPKRQKPDCIIMTNQDSCGLSSSRLSVFPFFLFQSQDNNSVVTNHHLICILPNWKPPGPKRQSSVCASCLESVSTEPGLKDITLLFSPSSTGWELWRISI